MSEATNTAESVAECAEFKVRSRLAQHLQEPHSPIRLRASDLVKLLEEHEQLRAQLATATAAHVQQVAAMQAQIDASEAKVLDERNGRLEQADLAAAADRNYVALCHAYDLQLRIRAAAISRQKAHIRRLQRELRAARAA